jgi:hypothetical protein
MATMCSALLTAINICHTVYVVISHPWESTTHNSFAGFEVFTIMIMMSTIF